MSKTTLISFLSRLHILIIYSINLFNTYIITPVLKKKKKCPKFLENNKCHLVYVNML